MLLCMWPQQFWNHSRWPKNIRIPSRFPSKSFTSDLCGNCVSNENTINDSLNGGPSKIKVAQKFAKYIPILAGGHHIPARGQNYRVPGQIACENEPGSKTNIAKWTKKINRHMKYTLSLSPLQRITFSFRLAFIMAGITVIWVCQIVRHFPGLTRAQLCPVQCKTILIPASFVFPLRLWQALWFA